MNERKILSVIIAAYNMEAYLPRCLESLLVADARLLSLLEVLVINDGSKDRTSEVAHAFAAKHPDVIRVIDKENGNYGSCINRGLDEATGVFVKCLDADDWFDTKVFERYLAFIELLAAQADGPDLVVNDYAMVDEADKVVLLGSYADCAAADFTLARFMTHFIGALVMHAVAYRTERVRALGYRQSEGISYTDNEWVFCPLATVRSFAYFPNGVLYRYWIGREGQTMESAVILKNYWMLLRIAERMVAWRTAHRAEFAEENRRYLDLRAALCVYMVFRTWLVNASLPRIGADDIARLDEALERDVPDVDAAFREFGCARRWVKAYVRLWRRHRANPLFKPLDRLVRRALRAKF